MDIGNIFKHVIYDEEVDVEDEIEIDVNYHKNMDCCSHETINLGDIQIPKTSEWYKPWDIHAWDGGNALVYNVLETQPRKCSNKPFSLEISVSQVHEFLDGFSKLYVRFYLLQFQNAIWIIYFNIFLNISSSSLATILKEI